MHWLGVRWIVRQGYRRVTVDYVDATLFERIKLLVWISIPFERSWHCCQYVQSFNLACIVISSGMWWWSTIFSELQNVGQKLRLLSEVKKRKAEIFADTNNKDKSSPAHLGTALTEIFAQCTFIVFVHTCFSFHLCLWSSVDALLVIKACNKIILVNSQKTSSIRK